MSKNFLIVDWMSTFCRAYFAMFQSDLKNADGIRTFAVKSFFSIIEKIKNKHKIDEIFFTWDTKTSKNKNREIDANYKATREYKNHLHFYSQADLIKQIISSLGMWQFESPHYEADDVIATLKTILRRKNDDATIFILSQDTDLYQLIDDKTFFIKRNTAKGSDKSDVIYGINQFKEDYLLEEEKHFVLLKSMVGDKSDNILWLKWIWIPKAIKILKESEFDLEKVLNHEKVLAQPDVNIKRNMLLIKLEENIANSDLVKTKGVEDEKKIKELINYLELNSLKNYVLFSKYFIWL